MDSFEFCLWLKGFFDLSDPYKLGAEQIAIIKKHLAVAVSPDPFVKATDCESRLVIGPAGEVSVSDEQT